ncbi:MAG: LTA synthase family protein [Bacillus sp. (in: Bacteria)]|nr:LTA synthase family protein [Bacillus sp. (in: firmicutes)]
MFQRLKSYYLLFYFLATLLVMEIIFRAATSATIFTKGLFHAALFSAVFAVGFFFISIFLKGTYRLVMTSVLMGIAAFSYASQMVYHNTFRTYYSVYSAGNAGQLTDFWRDTITLIGQNIVWIVLLFAPFLLLFFIKSYLFNKDEEYSNRQKSFILLACALTHFLGIGFIYAGDREQHSAYDLYFHNRNHVLSMDRLGLMTTMRLDLQRHALGWSPSVDVYAPIVEQEPLPPVSPVDEKVKDQGIDSTEKSDETEPPPPPEYNKMDIDFEKLIHEEEDEELITMHQYFQNVPPTEKNEFTGKYEGYNLILITAESYAPYAVRKEVTPTLYKMINEGYHFTNFYTPLWEVSTSDGEYVALTGLLPKSGVWSFEQSGSNYLPFVMGNQFKELGYKTVAYHNHTYTYYSRDISHPNMGYKYKGIGNGLDVRQVWPASDLEMMEVSVPEYVHEEPFHAYYMTVSGHMQYSFDGNVMARQNKDVVADLPYSLQGRAYIATHVELDRALEHLLEQLEEAGVADRTLIAISSDHYPYGLDDETIDELAGHEVERHFELYKNDFILYSTSMEEPLIIDKPSSSLDIIPTLSNLLGLEYDSRLLMGTDIFSDADPLVMFLDRSFITDKGKYNAVTREFIPRGSEDMNEQYIENITNVVNGKFHFSRRILETDYYDLLFNNE